MAAGDRVVGRRRQPGETYAPGDYGKDHDGTWMARAPRGDLGSLARHGVVEHQDGTITAWPSILITSADENGGRTTYHGFLERGVWREA